MTGLLVAPARGQGPATAPTIAPQSAAVVVPIEGTIDEYTAHILSKRLDEAREMGASTVILRLNTPGGLVTAGLAISKKLKETDDLHVVVFVDDMALSAGTMIALAAHEIVMEPHAMIGDAAPIAMSPTGGVESLGDAERAKAASPILRDFESSARLRGYDPLLVEAMVVPGRVVHWIENADGQRLFVGADEYKEKTKDGQWKAVVGAPNPLDAADSLLTVDADLAKRIGLARDIYPSVEAMSAARGLQIAAYLNPTVGDRVIGFLSSTTVRAILTTIFMFSLYMAFSTPGQGVAEVVAAVALATLVGVPLMTGYAQWWEIVAVLLGVALLAVELFLIPGFGVTGFTGIVLILMGLTMTFVPAEPPELPGVLPSLQQTWAALQRGVLVVTIGLTVSLLLWFWLSRYLPVMPYFNRLILGGVHAPARLPRPAPLSTSWPAVGDTGRALSDLRPGGTASFHDPAINDLRTTDVVSDSGFVPAGTPVSVREIHGDRIVVRPVKEQA